MHIQHVLKGIAGLNTSDADHTLRTGILCNWWREVGAITPLEVEEKLTARNLDWHLSRYDDFDPETSAPFHRHTPYISTTAGTFERNARVSRNLPRPALITALWFATDRFRADGHVFYAYLFALGRKAVELREFAEETRELHVYSDFQQYQPEGELVAKIEIPSVRIERWEAYHGPTALAELRSGVLPTPLAVQANANYQSPDRFANVRGVTI